MLTLMLNNCNTFWTRVFCILQVALPEKQPAFAFGIKHSPYTYAGKVIDVLKHSPYTYAGKVIDVLKHSPYTYAHLTSGPRILLYGDHP